MSEGPIKELPLAHRHEEFGAKFSPFAGFRMPMQYEGIMDEHKAVRESAGLFDVSHMGEIRLTGPDALEVANTLVSQDLSEAEDGQARYCVLCNEDGGIVDDLLAYKISDEEIFFCVNATGRDKDYAHMLAHIGDAEVTLTNESDDWVQLALQGPDAEEILAPICMTDVYSLEYYHFVIDDVAGVRCMISRTGYTGEDGFELYIPVDQAEDVFDRLVASGRPVGMQLCGLGARDTLRLEAKMALYGQDLSPETNPLEAGLSWVVSFDKPKPFIGQEAIAAVKASGVKRRLRGFKLKSRGVPRPGYRIMAGETEVGTLTSGTFSPTLGVGIGLGYVDVAHADAEELDIEIRGKRVPAEVTRKPFYKRD